MMASVETRSAIGDLCMNINTKATLQAHQAALYQLLQEFDRICRKHGIQYMLFAGTALGAVRHQGFIAWDDDLDVVMLRPEYERFLAIAEQDLNKEKFFLQKEFSEHWPLFFSKLRMNGTTCLERYVPKDLLTHQGVYMDIFPCDNLAEGKLQRKLQFYASKAVIAKSLYQRGYFTDSHCKKLFMGICNLFSGKFWRKYVQRKCDADTAWVHTFFGGASRYEKNIYSREWFTKTVDMPFEGGEYPVSAYYDELLTKLYGDYMTPLPEEKRGCKVHAELVDLNNPYTQYLGWQCSMEFSEHTKSIR